MSRPMFPIYHRHFVPNVQVLQHRLEDFEMLMEEQNENKKEK